MNSEELRWASPPYYSLFIIQYSIFITARKAQGWGCGRPIWGSRFYLVFCRLDQSFVHDHHEDEEHEEVDGEESGGEGVG